MHAQSQRIIHPFYDHAAESPLTDSVRATLLQQAETLRALADDFNRLQYRRALGLMLACRGHIIVCGMGKSGHVGRKIAATLASTGTPSFFLHPAEAFHGDLGMITPDDVVILISNSGETDEVLKLIPSLKSFGNPIIGITGGPHSTLAKNSDAVLEIRIQSEACPNNLAPTTSTTLTMAIGDALAIALVTKRQFKPQDFARFHPGGSLGRRLLTRVKDVMSKELTCVSATTPLREVIVAMTQTRNGLAVVNDGDSQMLGVITDGDLRRAMMRTDFDLDKIVAADVMTTDPVTLPESAMLSDAEHLMRERQIKQLVILDSTQRPCGIVEFFQ
ncbi:MAG: KpsF/GutQ family sugar-phosphate isomerase [Aeromonadaceae bacterium]